VEQRLAGQPAVVQFSKSRKGNSIQRSGVRLADGARSLYWSATSAAKADKVRKAETAKLVSEPSESRTKYVRNEGDQSKYAAVPIETKPSQAQLPVRLGKVNNKYYKHIPSASVRAKPSKSEKKPCPSFTRTGKCDYPGPGACPFAHDRARVAICQLWLRGACKAAPCFLSHNPTAERMPDCAHFLEGVCSADPCMYRHVNVGPLAPLCQAFVRGYCPKGLQCPCKHQLLTLTNKYRTRRQGDALAAQGEDGPRSREEMQRRDSLEQDVTKLLSSP